MNLLNLGKRLNAFKNGYISGIKIKDKINKKVEYKADWINEEDIEEYDFDKIKEIEVLKIAIKIMQVKIIELKEEIEDLQIENTYQGDDL